MMYYDSNGNSHDLVEAGAGVYPFLPYTLLDALSLTPPEGSYLCFKDGGYKWVKLPPQFKDYLDKL